MKKTVVAFTLATLMGMCVGAPKSFAATNDLDEALNLISNESFYDSSLRAEARVNWTGKAYLVTNAWSNITSSNNLFPDRPKVTNYASNKGTIKVRILNGNGAIVGAVKTVKKGESVTMDKIPAFSGTYTLQGMAVDTEGSYTINID